MLSFPNCYVCGCDNPQGLHIAFCADGADGCRAEYTARPEHVGWPGIIHGGMLFTLMDEAVAWALMYAGLHGVTARGQFRFCAPATVGARLDITARVVSRQRRLVRAHAEVRGGDNNDTLIAELDASMYLTDVDRLGGAESQDG